LKSSINTLFLFVPLPLRLFLAASCSIAFRGKVWPGNWMGKEDRAFNKAFGDMPCDFKILFAPSQPIDLLMLSINFWLVLMMIAIYILTSCRWSLEVLHQISMSGLGLIMLWRRTVFNLFALLQSFVLIMVSFISDLMLKLLNGLRCGKTWPWAKKVD